MSCDMTTTIVGNNEEEEGKQGTERMAKDEEEWDETMKRGETWTG